MNIGFDIDDTIAHYAKLKVLYAQAYDKAKASGKGILDINKWVTYGMFDWTDEQKKEYESQTVGALYPFLKPEFDGLQMMNLLRKEGHKIYLITRRGVDGLSKKKSTVKWLKELGVPYDKLVMNELDKINYMLKHNIEIYIDDSLSKCIEAEKAGIFAIQKSCFLHISDMPSDDSYDPKLKYKEGVFHNNCSSWNEVYAQIQKKINLKPMIERYPIIIDTDMTNEIDDEFTLAYLYSFENAQIEAVTIAQHFSLHRGQFDVAKNIERSYQKTLEITKLTRPDLVDKIYKGDTVINAFGAWEKEMSDAVKNIIRICHENDKVIFIAIGAMTNLAHALEIDPKIADKIKLYSLMGFSGINKLLPETNMTGDFYSTKNVLEMVKDKTIFPASDFSNLSLTLEDIKPYTKNNNLMKLLYEDTKSIYKLFNCKHKSFFDIIIPFYLSNPIPFVESETGIKINSTCVLYKKSKNKAVIATSWNQDIILKDLFKRLQKYEG
jgi:inosine-uridine nucleoside N-ribohydrolase/uncharacterized HAD superfamily protein